MSIRHQVSEGERSDVRWRVQALRDLCEEQPAGQSNGIHVQAEGPAGFPGSDGPEALGVL